MKSKDKKRVCETAESEGFDYCFIWYSRFPEVKDEKFHELREAYIKATKDLKNYIGFPD